MPTFKVPTIFTAIDKFSPQVKTMSNSLETFANRSERSFRKFSPAIGEANKQLLSMVGTTALLGAGFAGAAFSTKSLMDFEDSVKSIEAVTGESFDLFKKEVEELSEKSRKSSIEVVKSFEIIGSAMSQYLTDPTGLRQIAEAGITLSKASKMELEPALLSLTSVMNQFDIAAQNSEETINRLTAGEIVGSISTEKITNHLQQFGGVAKANNVTLSESVALLEVLGKKIPEQQLGTASRNLITFLSTAKGMPKEAQKNLLQYGVSMETLMDSSKTLSERLRELSKIQGSPIAMESFFGRENLSAGTALFQNIDLFEKWVKQIENTNQANKQASLNSDTLRNRIDELSNSWVNLLTSNENAAFGVDLFKKSIVFLTNNLEHIIGVIGIVAGAYLSWFAVIKILNAALLIQRGIIFLTASVHLARLAASLYGGTTATNLMKFAVLDLNAAFMANPIGVTILAVAGLTIGIYALSKAFKSVSVEQKMMDEITKRAKENTIDQQVEINMLFRSLRNLNPVSEEYKNILQKIEMMQPGIIEKYNLQAGAIDKINAAEKELIKTLIEKAKIQAKEELLREKQKEIIGKQLAAPTFAQELKGLLLFNSIKGGEGVKQAEISSLINELNALASLDVSADAVDRKNTEFKEYVNTVNKNINNSLTVDFTNLPNGATVKGDASSIGNITPSTSSTLVQ